MNEFRMKYRSCTGAQCSEKPDEEYHKFSNSMKKRKSWGQEDVEHETTSDPVAADAR